MKKVLLFLLGSLALVHGAFAEESDVTPGENQAVYISDQLKLAPKTQHEDNKDLRYTIEANFPQIEGAALTPGAIQFNALVNAMVKEELDRFKKYVMADRVHMQNLPDELKHNSLRIDYDTDVIKPGQEALVSVRLSIEGMQAGRAHPYHTNRVINFDLSANKLLTLKDLFKPKANYMKIISTYSKTKLDEKLKDKWMIADGTKPVEKNFKNWNLESDGIVFTFDEYQVAPYVDGTQEVSVPYAELKNIISPTSPIVPCVDDPKACAVQMFIPSTENQPTVE